jgi:hypothetical protein
MPRTRHYTVIGVHCDSGETCSDYYSAASPREACELFHREHTTTIVEVLRGWVASVMPSACWIDKEEV